MAPSERRSRCASASPTACGPSTRSESARRGRGGISEIHTINASGSAPLARFISRLATAHAAAAATHSDSPAAVTPPSPAAAMTPMPASAQPRPMSWPRDGRSRSVAAASSSVNGAWACRTTDANPAGMPRSIEVNSRPNLTTPNATPIPSSSRHGIRGRSTNHTNGADTSANRSAHSSSGGTSSRPTSITTKFSPHVAATATARSLWRSGIPGGQTPPRSGYFAALSSQGLTPSVVAEMVQHQRRSLAVSVSCASHAARRATTPGAA
jgi:hypothetical protein